MRKGRPIAVCFARRRKIPGKRKGEGKADRTLLLHEDLQKGKATASATYSQYDRKKKKRESISIFEKKKRGQDHAHLIATRARKKRRAAVVQPQENKRRALSLSYAERGGKKEETAGEKS